jgi:ankyrin repeat protein
MSDLPDSSEYSDSNDFVIVDKANTHIDLSSEILKLSTWLQPTAYTDKASEFHKHLSVRAPGTGDWIEEIPEYRKWHDAGSHGVLWIKAIAGGGKSVLMASRIDRMQRNDPKTKVIFFFSRQVVTPNYDGSHTLVRDWLDQLLPHSPSLQAILKARLDADSYCSATEMAFTELWQILTDALLAMTTPIYCVVDALDELEARDSNDLLSRLIDLGTRKPDLIKVLVSSRPLPWIQRIFGAVSTVISIRLENRLVNRDIARFIEYRLDQTTDLQKEICKKIKHLIEDHVFPSFLYARLMLDGLLEKHKYASLDIHSVQEAMLSIPTGLEDLYSYMLNNHSLRFNVPRERQILILQLATHATRPLRLLEIATVLEFLETKEDRRKHENFKNLTRMCCGPLLEILPDETVSVIHHSFTEFLLDASRADRTKMSDDDEFPVIDAVETNHLMALICLRYLLSSGLTPRKHPKVSRPGHDPWRDMQLAQLDFPFVKYAACNWYVHVSRLPKLDGELLELLDTFINPEIPSYLAFLELVMVEGHSSKPTVVSPLHVCAWGHMIGYANVLLQSGHDCNTPNGKKMTPLASAASKGFPDMVSLLLQHGATPNPPEVDQNGKMPLHYAAQSNHHQVVKLLLEAGADPLVYRSSMYDPPQCIRRIDLTSRQSPLEYACQAGAVESVEAMLPYLTVKDLELALKCSIKARQFEIVKLFMDLPDIDTKAKELMKECLSLALEAKDPRILHFFLDLAATSGNTPPAETLLLTFCESLDKGVLDRYGSVNNAEMCLNLILQTGCDVNTRWETGRTPLHACVHAMCPTFVEKLLEHGADVHATDLSGNTPLHVFGLEMVLTESTAPILDALMRHGARWDIASNDEGLTPLLALCSRGWVSREDIEKLQPYVKDWNVTDKEGNTPIHLLLKGRADKRTLQKLIDLGADPNRHNNEGLAPLHCIQTIDQVRLLLSVGADLETKDYQGRTLLLRTILARDLSRTLPELLELGANVNATDYDGNGALHLLCEHYRQVKSLRILLDAGANPIHCNNYGDTLWHTFMRHALQGNYDSLITLVYLLRQTGIPLTIRNHYGQTLLHCMCSASITDPEILLNPPDNPIDHLHVMEVDSMLEVEDHQGRRPIHLAAAHSEALVGWLIHRGATLTGKTRQGENLLHIAAAARESNIVGLLLKNYTDNQQKNMAVNDGDKDGCTPLHIACRSGQLESVVLLLQAGADVHVTNKKKETPLHACAEFKRQPRLSEYNRKVCGEDETLRVADIISLLRAHNADLFAQNNKQQSPLDFAVTKQNTEMVIALADTLRLTPHSPRPNAAQLYLTVGDDHIDALVEKLATIPHNTIFECEQLLKLGAYRVLERLGARGVRMYKEGKGYFENSDFLNTLARWGLLICLTNWGEHERAIAQTGSTARCPGLMRLIKISCRSYLLQQTGASPI